MKTKRHRNVERPAALLLKENKYPFFKESGGFRINLNNHMLSTEILSECYPG